MDSFTDQAQAVVICAGGGIGGALAAELAGNLGFAAALLDRFQLNTLKRSLVVKHSGRSAVVHSPEQPHPP